MVVCWNFEKGFQHNALVCFANTVTKLFGKTFYSSLSMPNWRILQKNQQISIWKKTNKIWSDKWDKVFKNGPSKICGRQPLKNLKGYGLLKQADHTYPFKFFKGCLSQILLGPLLNTRTQTKVLVALKIAQDFSAMIWEVPKFTD